MNNLVKSVKIANDMISTYKNDFGFKGTKINKSLNVDIICDWNFFMLFKNKFPQFIDEIKISLIPN